MVNRNPNQLVNLLNESGRLANT